MDHLDPLIAMLNEDEKDSFASHIDKSQRDNRESKLFALLTDGEERSPLELVRKLYGVKENAAHDLMNAYHSLRKRLMTRLISFVISNAMKADQHENLGVTGTIALCEIFIHRERLSLAKHFLQKAEKKATTFRQYDMLDQLYNFQLAYSHVLELNLNDIILKSIENARKMEIQRKLNFALAMLRNKLQDLRIKGDTLHPASVTKLILDELQIDERDTSEPLFQFRMLAMYRTALLSVKEYFDLEAYIKSMYLKLKLDGAFTKADLQTEQGFLFFLAHAQYRNRKFNSALKTLQEAEEIIPNLMFKASPYYFKMISLRAAIEANRGYNHIALELMHKNINLIRKITDSGEQLNMMLNYCVYFFNAGDFKSASTMLRETDTILKSSKKDMGKEWVFKKRMIHLIIRIELESFHEVEKLMKGIKDDYAQFFKHPVYQRAGIFLGLIEEYIKDPMQVTEPEFFQQVKNSGLAWPGHKEDIQAITFFCWLLSKMMRRPYYVILMERMREGISETEFKLPDDFEDRYGR